MSDESSSEEDSSSDEDVPISQLKKTSLRSKRRKSTSSTSTSTDSDRPLVPRKIKKKAPRKKTPSRSNRKRKRKRFGDSEDEDEESSSASDSDDDEPIVKAAKQIKAPPKKKRRSAAKSSPRSPSRSPSRRKVSGSAIRGCLGKDVHPASNYKKKASIVPLVPRKGTLRWWEELDDLTVSYSANDDKKDKVKWTTLDHNGVVFAPEYVPHGVPMLYGRRIRRGDDDENEEEEDDDEEVEELHLCPEQEEIATMFAMVVGTEHEQKKVFRQNFFKEFKRILNDKKQPKRFAQVKDLAKCDFSKIVEWYRSKKEAEKEKRKSAEYKARIKEEKEDFDSKFGFALVDGIREPVGNYKVEPPGLFRGRGEHPKTGMLKQRIMPKDIILNIGKGMEIPPCPIEGQEWGGIIHDPTVTYIAKWVENIQQQHKFVFLGSSSRFKGQADRNKYEKARVLKTKIDDIRADYGKKLSSSNELTKQLATAVWMIDVLSIRVGNEKDTDEEADTVGVCSLRKEHMTMLNPADHGGEFKITLDFLGKDSMRYHQTVSVTEKVYQNLKAFIRGKKDDQDIFSKIDPNTVNKYLKDQMEGLTAKVFRTHNASTTLQKELAKGYHANCGKITVHSSLDEKVFYYNQCNMQVAILCNHQKSVSKGHAEQLQRLDEKMADLKQAIREKEEELEDARGTPKEEKIEKQLLRKRDMLRKKELAKAMKEDNKEVALGTSKINYMDPRVTVAWCKKMQVPIEKIFNKSLLDKFPWAMQATTKYNF